MFQASIKIASSEVYLVRRMCLTEVVSPHVQADASQAAHSPSAQSTPHGT